MITATGDRPVGFTATSLNSVAAEPPLISFGIRAEEQPRNDDAVGEPA
ncbi:hypothetical protein SMICM304S_06833 [Streptomyces microflavus]